MNLFLLLLAPAAASDDGVRILDYKEALEAAGIQMHWYSYYQKWTPQEMDGFLKNHWKSVKPRNRAEVKAFHAIVV